MNRQHTIRPAGPRLETLAVAQPELPFLTAERTATIDAARVAIERAQQSAAAARRWADADELCRLGMQLVDLLEDNATAVRAGGQR